MNRGFQAYHPIINFGYFCLVIGIGVFLMHPIFLVVGIAGSFIYGLILNGRGTLRFSAIFLLPMTVVFGVVNALVNPRGSTVLIYTSNSQITLEALLYGLSAGLLLSTIMLWFSCYNKVMTRDKFIYIFGRITPSLSLIFSMVMGFIPRFKHQIKVIYNGQRCMDQDAPDVKLLDRIKQGGRLLSTMMTWELENSIDTSDSMQARGYGVRNRSNFTNYRFTSRDAGAAVIMAVAAGLVIVGGLLGRCSISFYPEVILPVMDVVGALALAGYTALALLPTAVELREVISWKYSRQKI
jgi:energy-coupling factor transport system permease protein